MTIKLLTKIHKMKYFFYVITKNFQNMYIPENLLNIDEEMVNLMEDLDIILRINLFNEV